jgi:hypothetical protein
MRVLRRVVLLLFALAGCYSLYWLWLESRIEPQIAAWAATGEARGLSIKHGSVNTSGFPLALDVALTAPELDSKDGWGFRGERLRAHLNPFMPRRIALWLDGQFVMAIGATGTLMGEAKEARAEFSLADGAPHRLSLVVTDFAGKARGAGETRVWPVRAQHILLRLWGPDEDSTLAPDDRALALAGDGLVVPGSIVPSFGQEIPKLALSAKLHAAAPALAAISEAQAQLAAWMRDGGVIELTQLGVSWGALDILASGTLGFDRVQRPEGAFTILIDGHRRLIRQLVADGRLQIEQAAKLSLALDQTSAAGNDAHGRLSVPVVMRQGRFLVGPVDLCALKPWS